jgi:hypothetical protein
LKSSVTAVDEYGVVQLVSGGFEMLHLVIHVRVGGEQILPSVVVKVE